VADHDIIDGYRFADHLMVRGFTGLAVNLDHMDRRCRLQACDVETGADRRHRKSGHGEGHEAPASTIRCSTLATLFQGSELLAVSACRHVAAAEVARGL